MTITQTTKIERLNAQKSFIRRLNAASQRITPEALEALASAAASAVIRRNCEALARGKRRMQTTGLHVIA